MSECIFCDIVAGEAPSVKVVEDEGTLTFMDIHPGTEGHLLVVPKRHSTDLLDIPPADLAAVALTAQRAGRAVIDELGADGVNLLNCCRAQAWQTVYHFHMHVVPRYADRAKDALVVPWTPGVPADPRLIARLGGRLAAALQ